MLLLTATLLVAQSTVLRESRIEGFPRLLGWGSGDEPVISWQTTLFGTLNLQTGEKTEKGQTHPGEEIVGCIADSVLVSASRWVSLKDRPDSLERPLVSGVAGDFLYRLDYKGATFRLSGSINPNNYVSTRQAWAACGFKSTFYLATTDGRGTLITSYDPLGKKLSELRTDVGPSEDDHSIACDATGSFYFLAAIRSEDSLTDRDRRVNLVKLSSSTNRAITLTTFKIKRVQAPDVSPPRTSLAVKPDGSVIVYLCDDVLKVYTLRNNQA